MFEKKEFNNDELYEVVGGLGDTSKPGNYKIIVCVYVLSGIMGPHTDSTFGPYRSYSQASTEAHSWLTSKMNSGNYHAYSMNGYAEYDDGTSATILSETRTNQWLYNYFQCRLLKVWLWPADCALRVWQCENFPGKCDYRTSEVITR